MRVLADAILELANDPSLRRRIAACGAREVREAWLWDKVVDRMLAVYRDIGQAAPLGLR